MTESRLKGSFRELISDAPALSDITRLAEEAQAGGFAVEADIRIRVAAWLAHVGFLAPDRVGETYDAFAEGWLGRAVEAPPIKTLALTARAVPDGLLDAYWSIVDDGVAGTLDAASITERTAGLGKLQSEGFHDRLAEASMLYPGIAEVAGQVIPPIVKLAEVSTCPTGSIGRLYHDLIVDNGFDLEVLDGKALGLSQLPSPLDYLNARNLQTHDLWHLVAGYETTVLHEFSIAAFQVAQFGHSYSANLLAVMAGVAALSPPIGFPILMDSVFAAWVHGRQTPQLMRIGWEELWTHSVSDIRSEYDIKPYQSPHPANLIEVS